HVGVGEVFVGAGQSNSTNCAQYKISQTSGMVSSFSGESWRLADDPQLGTHDKTKDGSFWPAFGDAMYVKYHVPIGVAVTGHGGTYSLQWLPDNPMGLFSWTMTRIYQLGSNGFRAVLWHQGESDVTENTPSDVYVSRLTNMITQSNTLAGWQFPWFVANVSYVSAAQPTNSVIRGAQQRLWATGVALEGPDTDTLGSDYRDNTGVHFNPNGLHTHGQMWADKVGVYLDKVL
ncbi:sialate O-acetylesterase, partial [bacterium]|nr:sialate O-acetylesterase [bacterium]